MSLARAISYHRWAIERCLEACVALTSEEFLRDLGGSFPSVRDTLAHCLMADNAWAHRVRGESFTRPAPDALPTDLESLRQQWLPVLASWDQLAADRNPLEMIEYAAFDGSTFKSSFEDILRQIVNHGSYHRGQVTMMLRLLGHKPLSTDWISFTRLEH